MKRFKIGFLAIIAISAMSFTIASQNGYFKGNFKNTLSGCFASFPTTNIQCNPTSSIPGQDDETLDLCLGYTTTPGAFGETRDPESEIQCPEGSDELCCLQIEDDPQDCCETGFSFKIKAAYYREFLTR
jgi:hypothetical protein